jgi:hypothetical protein
VYLVAAKAIGAGNAIHWSCGPLPRPFDHENAYDCAARRESRFIREHRGGYTLQRNRHMAGASQRAGDTQRLLRLELNLLERPYAKYIIPGASARGSNQ